MLQKLEPPELFVDLQLLEKVLKMRQSIDSGIRDRFKNELSYLLSCIGTKFPRREANRYEQRMMLTMDDPADYFIKMSTLIMSVRKKLPDPNEPARTSYDYGHDAFMLTVLEYFGKRFEFLKRSNLAAGKLVDKLLDPAIAPDAAVEKVKAEVKRLFSLPTEVKDTLNFLLNYNLKNYDLNVINIIAAYRTRMLPGFRSLCKNEVKSAALEIPPKAFFVPFEMALLAYQDFIEYKGFALGRSLDNGEMIDVGHSEIKARFQFIPSVIGLGIDAEQPFSIHPRNSFRRENFRFSQNYLSTGLTIEYKGSFRGAVLIGTWWCAFDESMNGSFAIWPLNYEDYYCPTPALEEKRGERNENEAGILYVEINNEDVSDVAKINERIYRHIDKVEDIQKKQLLEYDSDGDTFSDCFSDIYEDIDEEVQTTFVICSDCVLSLPNESLAGIQYFNWSLRSGNETEIELPLFDGQAVKVAIDIKEGRIPERIHDYLQVFTLGVFLLEPVVMEKVIEIFCENETDPDFALYIIGMKEIFELPTFNTDSLYEFIDFHFTSAIESRLWVQLSETLLRRIIRRTTLFILDDRAIISGIKKWLDVNMGDDDENYSRLVTSMSTYVTETPPKNWKNDELWSWLMDELGLETVKCWDALFSGENGFRSNPRFPEKIFLVARNSINKPCIYQHNPDSIHQDFNFITEIPDMNFPGDAGHMVPLRSDCGTMLIFFGGELKRAVWGYSVTYALWFSLPALPRRVWNAGVQTVHHQESAGDYIYIVGGYGKYSAGEEGPAKGMDIIRFSFSKINWNEYISDFYSCRHSKNSDGWEHFSCPMVRSEHHTGANLCLVDLFSRKSVERRQRTIRTHISSDALYLLVIGGKYPHRNPSKISSLEPDELITLVPLGTHKKDDLSNLATNDEIIISRQTFSDVQQGLNLYSNRSDSSLFSMSTATKLGLSLEQLVLTGNLPISRENGKMKRAPKFFPQPLATSQESSQDLVSKTDVCLLAEYAFLKQVTFPLEAFVFPSLSDPKTPALNFLGTPRWGGESLLLSYDIFNSKLEELREIPDFKVSPNLSGLQQTHFSLLKSLFFNYVHL